MPCMGQNPLPLKINFFFYDKDLFCFNVSFLFISQFRPTFLMSYRLAFVPKCYQYSWCNPLLKCYNYMYFGGLHNGCWILLSNYNRLISILFSSKLGCSQ